MASAVTGEEAYSVGYTQKMGGRVANPEKNPRAKSLEEMIEEEIESLMAEDDDWIQKAVDPDHEGDCTPMTKKTCTPPRKALAKRFKKAAKKKEKQGGTGWQGKV